MIPSDTIVAISTPPGMGAIAVVRLSGPDAFRIASLLFTATKSGSDKKSDLNATGNADIPNEEQKSSHKERAEPDNWDSHRARIGHLKDPDCGSTVDQVVVIPYKGPRTYTGEDLIEINCHGGWLIPNEIVSLCLRLGARLAGPGEFTERAFLSGRIDLTQAEAVLDLIQAKTSRQGRLAVSALSGQLGARINEVRSRLIDLMAQIVAGIDFPEEVGETAAEDINPTVDSCLSILQDLSRTARSGRFLRDGLRLAIVGRPNAGKSSLLNQLLKFERAIVTDTPGTTRDSLEELLDVNGLPVILVDTAGIRPTDDRLEQAGIERTVAAVNQSDLVLFVMDLAGGWGKPEEEIERLIAQRPYILVGNKVDLVNRRNCDDLLGGQPESVAAVAISALSGEGLPNLTSALEKWVFGGQSGREIQPSLNARQAELCSKAASALSLVKDTLAQGMPQDCLATDLKGSVDALSEICGESVSEEIIHKVFANFCIGK